MCSEYVHLLFESTHKIKRIWFEGKDVSNCGKRMLPERDGCQDLNFVKALCVLGVQQRSLLAARVVIKTIKRDLAGCAYCSI